MLINKLTKADKIALGDIAALPACTVSSSLFTTKNAIAMGGPCNPFATGVLAGCAAWTLCSIGLFAVTKNYRDQNNTEKQALLPAESHGNSHLQVQSFKMQ